MSQATPQGDVSRNATVSPIWLSLAHRRSVFQIIRLPWPFNFDSTAASWTMRGVSSMWVVLGIIVIVVLLTSCFAEHPKKLGLLKDNNQLDDPKLWEDHAQLTKFMTGATDIEKYAEFHFTPIAMNRPWRKTPMQEAQWGGESAFSENEEWKGGVPFPNGETREDSALWMTLALWKFMLRWKTGGAKWCTAMVMIQAFVPPLTAQVTSFLIDEIGKEKAGSRQHLLLYCFTILFLHMMHTASIWKYELEVPEGGPIRELKVRCQHQFIRMKNANADLWPEGKCAGLIEYDCPATVSVWIAYFNTLRYLTSFSVLFVMVMLNNRKAGTALTCVVLFATLFLGTLIDMNYRKEHIEDFSERKRDWTLAESALGALQVRMTRERDHSEEEIQAHGKDFEDASFCLWYRKAHSWFVRLAATRVGMFVGAMVVATVSFTTGCHVMDGDMSVGQAIAVITAMNQLRGQQAACVDMLTSLMHGLPSLRAVAEVLNTDVSAESRTNSSPNLRIS